MRVRCGSVIVVVGVLVGVAGCSSISGGAPAADTGASSVPASPTLPAPSAPADGGSVSTTYDITNLLSQYGHECGPGSNPNVSDYDGAIDAAQCSSPGGGSQDTQVIVFKDHASAAAYGSTAVVAFPSLPAETSAVVGVNWVLATTSSDFASIAHTVLGGQLLAPQAAPSQTPAATPAPEQVTYSCTGHGGVQITYGPNGSEHSAYSLPFHHTDPLTQGAQYYVTIAQLQGGGSVSCTTTVQTDDLLGYAQAVDNTGSADGGYNIATAQVCSGVSGWEKC